VASQVLTSLGLKLEEVREETINVTGGSTISMTAVPVPAAEPVTVDEHVAAKRHEAVREAVVETVGDSTPATLDTCDAIIATLKKLLGQVEQLRKQHQQAANS
jgi:hypothetical protein